MASQEAAGTVRKASGWVAGGEDGGGERLKPYWFLGPYGTTEVVPLQRLGQLSEPLSGACR